MCKACDSEVGKAYSFTENKNIEIYVTSDTPLIGAMTVVLMSITLTCLSIGTPKTIIFFIYFKRKINGF